MNYVPDPSNYVMKTNPRQKSVAMDKPPQTPITAEQLADKDFLRNICAMELVEIIRANGGDIRGLGAITLLWDRIDGKPASRWHNM